MGDHGAVEEMRQDRADRLAALRARVRVIERGAGAPALRTVPLGLAALDEVLPGGGLPLAGLHEIEPERSEWDDGPAAGFVLALAARLLAALPGPLLWVSRSDDLYAPAAAAAGVPPTRLIRARASGDNELLWALEEGLRCPELAAVVGEAAELEPAAARRLQLAAESAGRPCLMLRRRRVAPRGRRAALPALSRWRVAAAASVATLPRDQVGRPRDQVGRPRWRVALLRCRGARPADFELEWDDATGALAVAAGFRDRAAAAAG